MPIVLGRVPDGLLVWLLPSDPFTAELDLDGGGAWPTGTVCQLVLTGGSAPVVWAAQVNGDALTFSVPDEQVAAALAGGASGAALTLDGVTVAQGTVRTP